MTTQTAISWSFIRQFNFTNPPRIVLGRSEEVDSRYKEDCKAIKERGSVKNHLEKKYLSRGNHYHMTLNNYPYFMEEGIVHYVIWFKGGHFGKYNNQSEINSIIRDYMISNHINDKCEYTFYQNIEELRSIPSIPHLHVFMKLF